MCSIRYHAQTSWRAMISKRAIKQNKEVSNGINSEKGKPL